MEQNLQMYVYVVEISQKSVTSYLNGSKGERVKERESDEKFVQVVDRKSDLIIVPFTSNTRV